jgi:hypothetical protein
MVDLLKKLLLKVLVFLSNQDQQGVGRETQRNKEGKKIEDVAGDILRCVYV